MWDTETVILAHVGDSRAYRFRAGHPCEQLTQDDSWLVAMMSQSETPIDTKNHPLKHVLTNVLGAREQTEIHVAEHAVQLGDRFLLCSDGLHGTLTNSQLEQIMSSPDAQSAQQVAERLVLEALSNGSRDNVSAIVIEFGGSE